MRSLLNHTLKIYVLLSVIVLLLCAPLFFFMIRKLIAEDADEGLLLYKKEFVQTVQPTLNISDIPMWNRVSRDIKIENAVPAMDKDSLYETVIFDSLENENEPFRILKTPVEIEGQPYTLSVRVNQVESEDMIAGIALNFVLVIILLLGGLIILSRFFLPRLWKPFYGTLEKIEKFQIDKSAGPVLPNEKITEFTRLNESLNMLIQKNQGIYQEQQEFIENAAHELQTPLAVFQAKLDLLMQEPGMNEAQAAILQKLNETSARLNRLNKNLLLLSKIDRDHYPPAETVFINSLLKELLEFFTEQALGKNIKMETGVMEEKSFSANASLCEILFSNLFLNAIRHSPEGGVIRLALNQNRFSVENSGTLPLQQERLFVRFSKSDHSTQGNGLGLAIVKKIADLYGWKITYRFREGFHRFEIIF